MSLMGGNRRNLGFTGKYDPSVGIKPDRPIGDFIGDALSAPSLEPSESPQPSNTFSDIPSEIPSLGLPVL